MPHRPLSALSHVEFLTPYLADSVEFAHDMLGLDVVAEIGNSVYMRCWGDYYSHSVVYTRAEEPGLGHAAFRTWNAEQLRIAAASVEDAGTKGHWTDKSFGRGTGYRFVGPGGHTTELVWEVDRAVAPAGEASIYPERPQRPSRRGLSVRMLDHLTVTAPDVKEAMYWHRDVLDFRLMAAIEPAPGEDWFFGVATNNEKSHDFGFLRDMDGESGRLHHLAFWVETNHDLTEGAKFLLEHGCDIDFGPGQHGIGEQNYLYFRDPAGLRYELNSSGYRNYVPDWEPVIWTPADGPNTSYRTEIAMPAVHMVNIPPGKAGKSHDKALAGGVYNS
jgi:catechol 2,3-dioxygenase